MIFCRNDVSQEARDKPNDNMISANVTAMRTHVDEILSWEADIVMLQETRLTKVGQQVMIEASTKEGWQMLCGHHLETKRGGIWDASPGGVAVLIKKGWAAKVVKPDKNDANAEMLWQSTRFVHVYSFIYTVPNGNGWER